MTMTDDDFTEPTRTYPKTPRLLRQVPNRSVSPSTKTALVPSPMGRTRSVYSVGRRQRSGLCLAEVSFSFACLSPYSGLVNPVLIV